MILYKQHNLQLVNLFYIKLLNKLINILYVIYTTKFCISSFEAVKQKILFIFVTKLRNFVTFLT